MATRRGSVNLVLRRRTSAVREMRTRVGGRSAKPASPPVVGANDKKPTPGPAPTSPVDHDSSWLSFALSLEAGPAPSVPPAPPGTTPGVGEPLEASDRAYFERRFDRDLGRVRIHTGPEADGAARAVNAMAFTVGQNIVFRAGQGGGTSSARQLLAHELAHTIQQQDAPAPTSPRLQAYRLSRSGEASEVEAEKAAGQVLDERQARPPHVTAIPEGSPIVHRQAAPQPASPQPAAPATPALSERDSSVLAEHGIALDRDDSGQLAGLFPGGFALQQAPLYLLLSSGNAARGYRLIDFRVTPAAPLTPAVEAHIFQVGKGRAILATNVGGQNFTFDLGVEAVPGGAPAQRSGVSEARRLADAVEQVFAAGLTRGPLRVQASHTDADHLNAVSEFVRRGAFSQMEIEIAREQLRSAVGGRDWSNLGINLEPTQRLIEIDVAGSSGAASRQGAAGQEVHVRRRIIGNMELTEFRSVEAHSALAGATSASYDKNRTSPVTVVADLVTGERMIFTADARGRQFSEIVNAIGEAAFMRIMGAEGRNLRLLEYPHHGGRVQGGPDVAGMIRMLRMTLEASGGSARLFAQTSAGFSARASASIQFLDLVGVEVERIPDDPSPGGQSQVTRARSSQLERVTLDVSGIQSVAALADAPDSPVRQAYRRLAEMRGLQERATSLQEALEAGSVNRQLLQSIGAIRAELDTREQELRSRLNGVWTEMETAAGGAQGMRAGQDLTRVNAEIASLGRVVETTSLVRSGNSLDAHEAQLSAYERMFSTLIRMSAALETENYQELNRLRPVYGELLQQARGALGPREVDEHVRAAWAAVHAEWTGERIQRVTESLGSSARARRMLTEYRTGVLQSLGRQMQLNELAERAMHGIGGRQVYGPNGTLVTPMRTRVGGGILAAIEIIRIGLELAASYRESSERLEAAAQHSRTEGTRAVLWWVAHGAHPTLSLVKRGFWSGYNRVSDSMSQQQIMEAVAGEPTEGVPEHEMVVIENIPDADLLFVINELFLSATTLEDFHRLNDSNPFACPLFRRFSQGWGVWMWDRGEERYLYVVKAVIQDPLNALERQLEAGQQAVFNQALGRAGGEAQTIRDTAWVFGAEREALVFSSAGNLLPLDFEGTEPRFVRRGTQWEYGRQYALVQAVDLPTYRRLTEYFWRTETGTFISAAGMGRNYSVFRNREGLALVEPGNIIRRSA
jgi:hypothetical protein